METACCLVDSGQSVPSTRPAYTSVHLTAATFILQMSIFFQSIAEVLKNAADDKKASIGEACKQLLSEGSTDEINSATSSGNACPFISDEIDEQLLQDFASNLKFRLPSPTLAADFDHVVILGR